jgi:septum formation protein
MLVLASASPRRRELLAQVGYQFEVHPAHVPEEPLPGEDPIVYVTRLAREKAEAVYNEVIKEWQLKQACAGLETRTTVGQEGGGTKGIVGLAVLGADTTVELDGAILGKPEDAAGAARILRLLSGRTHRVITGVALVTAERTEVAAEATAVRFLALSDEEIAAYVATGEPMDKAGAYGIQGRAARWIPRIDGCYFNVMGLPLALVCAMLESCGAV